MIGAHELTKVCRECGVTKPISDFYKNRPQWDTRSNFCKTCYSARVQRRKRGEQVGDKPVLLAEAEKSGVKICRACGIEKPLNDFYYEKRYNHHQPNCKSCHNSKRKVAWSKRPKTQPLFDKPPITEDQKKKLLQQRRYNAQRKLRRMGKSIDYIGNGLESVIKRDKQICYLCNGFVEWNDLEFDHVIPLSRGGTDTLDNIKVTHRTCNRQKHDKLLEEYRIII